MKQRHIIITASALLLGCEASYRDVSSEHNHKLMIGRSCVVTSDLRAHGVTRTIERDKTTDYVSIWNPGFTGPEMTFLVILSPGTRLKILSARECTNCPFDRMLEYEVKVDPEPHEFKGKPAFARAESMVPPHVHCPVADPA
jgi:hypothetical protein